MKLTKKYFDKIADIIANSKTSDRQKQELAEDFADWLRTTNSNFDTVRFVDKATGDHTL